MLWEGAFMLLDGAILLLEGAIMSLDGAIDVVMPLEEDSALLNDAIWLLNG